MIKALGVLMLGALIGGCASMDLGYSYPPRPGQSAAEYAADKAECEARVVGWRRTALWAIDPVEAAAIGHDCMAAKGYTYTPRHTWE
jgi:hypothetical protein